jgi:putative tryptophan/tyrosine transport system substrate-binding protein
LPTMQASRESIEAAGLISYGPSFPDLSRRAADYVDKILRGATPPTYRLSSRLSLIWSST